MVWDSSGPTAGAAQQCLTAQGSSFGLGGARLPLLLFRHSRVHRRELLFLCRPDPVRVLIRSSCGLARLALLRSALRIRGLPLRLALLL